MRQLHPVLVACAPWTATAHAQAPSTGPGQAYPSRTVRVIVPNAPAGVADVAAAIVATTLGEAMGQHLSSGGAASSGSGRFPSNSASSRQAIIDWQTGRGES